MAEHERATQGKKDKTDPKHSLRQHSSQPQPDQIRTQEEDSGLLSENPFYPRIEEHSAILASIPHSTQRDEFIRQIHQTYGNRYVQRMVESVTQRDDSPIIFRAANGIVIKKTFLMKPDRFIDSPTKKKIQPELMPRDSLEMLEQKSPSDEYPTWQMVRHLKTGAVGFVRLSEVAAIKDQTAEGMDKTQAFEDAIESLTGIIGGVGSMEGMDEARKTGLEKYLDKLWSEDPQKVIQLANLKDQATPEKTKEEAAKEWEKLNPEIVNITKGIMLGGLGVGIAGDVLSGFGGLAGMVIGIAKFWGPEAKAKDKWEAALSTYKGGSAVMTGTLGAVEKTAKIAGEVSGEETIAGQLTKGLSGSLGVIGSGIKTVKGCVDTVVLVYKGVAALVNKKKKGAPEGHEIGSWFAEFFSTIGGAINGAIKTATGVLDMLKVFPVVSQILGIVGAVISLVTAACDSIKNGIKLVKWIMGMKKNTETMQKIEDKEYVRTERLMGDKLRRLMGKPSMGLRQTKEGKPEPAQIGEAMSKYEKKRKGRTDQTEKDYREVKQYRLDRDIVNNLKKNVMRGLSRIPEFVADGLADAFSIVGALVSVGTEIATILLAPTGIGAGIAKATGIISSVVTGVISGFLKLFKTGYSVGRSVVRWIGQKAKGKDWQAAKQEKRKWDAIALMQAAAELQGLDRKDKATRAAYARIELRLEATGVNLKKLYSKNNQPAEQVKLLYKALLTRE